MSDIFVSYARADRVRIKPIVEVLQGQGWSVWWDHHIPPGKTFSQVIKEELKKAKCVLVVWSKASVISEWVETEAAQGKQRNIFVPVLIDDVEKEIPLEFIRVQAASLKGWDGSLSQPDIQILLNELSTILKSSDEANRSGKLEQDGTGLSPSAGVNINSGAEQASRSFSFSFLKLRPSTWVGLVALAIAVLLITVWFSIKNGKEPLRTDEIVFVRSSYLTPDIERNFHTSLNAFQRYFLNIGGERYRSGTGPVEIAVVPADTGSHWISFYNPQTQLITIAAPYIADEDSIFREYTYHVLYSLIGSEATAIKPNFTAIESGLAAYYPCSYSNDPLLGKKSAEIVQQSSPDKRYFWKLKNRRKFSEIADSQFSTINDGAEIWGGAFWEIRELLGQETSDKILLDTWVHLQSSDFEKDSSAAFAQKLFDASERLNTDGKRAENLKSIFVQRGLAL